MERTATTELPGDAEEWVLTGMAFFLPGLVVSFLSGLSHAILFPLGLFAGIFLSVGYLKARGRYGG